MSDSVVEWDGITPLALLQEWMVALGEPGWNQVEGMLRDSTEELVEVDSVDGIETRVGYCCLGVLCELGTRHGLVERERNKYRFRGENVSTPFGEVSPQWNDGVLPERFAEWLGLSAQDPKIAEECAEHGRHGEECPAGYACEYRDKETLSALNDAGQAFTYIRDIVQAQIVEPREKEEARG